MAQKSSTRTRTVYRKARGAYSRRSVGGTKQILDGVLAGVGGQLAGKYVGGWGAPIATLGVGMFRNNTTLKTIGGLEIGGMIAGMIPFIGNGGTNGSGGLY
jgi:hypothetical protein